MQYITKDDKIILDEETRRITKPETTCETFNNLVAEDTQKNAFSDLNMDAKGSLETLWVIYRIIICHVKEYTFFSKRGTLTTLSKMCLENFFN